MKHNDEIFTLLKAFSEAAEYSITSDGQSVQLVSRDGQSQDVDAQIFKNMALVNDVIAKNINRSNPYAPYDAERAQQLKPIFLDALAQVRQSQWRAKSAPAKPLDLVAS